MWPLHLANGSRARAARVTPAVACCRVPHHVKRRRRLAGEAHRDRARGGLLHDREPGLEVRVDGTTFHTRGIARAVDSSEHAGSSIGSMHARWWSTEVRANSLAQRIHGFEPQRVVLRVVKVQHRL